MALEIEAKLKIDDPQVIRDRLIAVGATLVGDFLETDTFFDTADRTLLCEDRGLRLRIKRNLRDDQSTHELTYKGPRQPGALKSRQELQLTVSSAEDAAALLQALDFAPVVSFEKRRQIWRLGGCEVALDQLPILGHYVEIEGPSENAVLIAQQQLNLADSPSIKTSYVAMLMDYLQKNNQSGRTIRLAAPPVTPGPPPR